MNFARRQKAAPRQLTGRRTRIEAFTLIELLIVMAIIGIIGGISVSTYVRESRVSAVKQAAIQLQTDLETLRSNTIRYNGDSSIVVNSTGYTLNIAIDGSTRTVTRTLSTGMIANRVTGTSDVTYNAPLATTDAQPLKYEVKLGDISYYIKVIGVTGRAIFSAQ